MDYTEFKEQVGIMVGLDLQNYKNQQMDRRINSLKQFWGIETYEEMLQVLRTDNARYREFVNKLTINVSEFFRNPERYQELFNQILPELLSRGGPLRIWSAGCSDGSEPYSVSILIKELHAEDRVKVLATDFDREILKRAQEAVYKQNEVRHLPVELLQKYFDVQEGQYMLSDAIKKMVEFRHHNLLVDSFEPNFDLIICRNVVIYFTEEAKEILYKKFYAALRPGGYLLVGGTEPILNYRQYGFVPGITSFYKKP